MSNGTVDPWYNAVEKDKAVFNVLRYTAEFPEQASACVGVGNDDKAHQFFKDHSGSGMDVPADGSRVIFFKPGEKALLAGGSIMIEIPPVKMIGVPDTQLMNFLLTKYPYWPPGTQAALANLINWDQLGH